MEKDCNPSCVAYSASGEFGEGLKEMGMNDNALHASSPGTWGLS